MKTAWQMPNIEFEKMTKRKLAQLRIRLKNFYIPVGLYIAINWKGEVAFTRECPDHCKKDDSHAPNFGGRR